MPQYTAYYESLTPDGNPVVPVMSTADTFREAVHLFNEWRSRKRGTEADSLISPMPYGITRDAIVTDEDGTRQFYEVLEWGRPNP